MRRGFTLVEIVATLVVAGVLLLIALPRVGAELDALAVRRAAGDAWSFYQTARLAALVHGAPVRVLFRPDSLIAAYELAPDSVFLRRPGPGSEGVDLLGSRLETRLRPSGLGAGAANLTLTFRRGAAQEKLTLSRLGRMKWWR